VTLTAVTLARNMSAICRHLGIPVNGGPKFNYRVEGYTVLYAWRRGSFRVRVGVRLGFRLV